MKGKKIKNIRKGIKIYSSEFGFREPYQVLVEGEFLNQSLKYRLNLKEKISECFDGQVKLMITTCTIQDLRSKGDDYTGSVVAAKRFVRRRCPHQTAIKGIDCMKEIIGPTNEFRYCVASRDQDLNKNIQDIPAIPLLTLSRDTLVLAPLSAASQAKINKTSSAKLLPSADELKRLKAVTGLDLESLKEPQLPLHRRKKAKGPNPLSVKKKKHEFKPKKIQATKEPTSSQPQPTNTLNIQDVISENSGNVEEAAPSLKTKAKRKRRRPAKKSVPSFNMSKPEQSNDTDNSEDENTSDSKKAKRDESD